MEARYLHASREPWPSGVISSGGSLVNSFLGFVDSLSVDPELVKRPYFHSNLFSLLSEYLLCSYMFVCLKAFCSNIWFGLLACIQNSKGNLDSAIWLLFSILSASGTLKAF